MADRIKRIQLQSMGFSAEQAAGFMGAVEMSGLDTSRFFAGSGSILANLFTTSSKRSRS